MEGEKYPNIQGTQLNGGGNSPNLYQVGSRKC